MEGTLLLARNAQRLALLLCLTVIVMVLVRHSEPDWSQVRDQAYEMRQSVSRHQRDQPVCDTASKIPEVRLGQTLQAETLTLASGVAEQLSNRLDEADSLAQWKLSLLLRAQPVCEEWLVESYNSPFRRVAHMTVEDFSVTGRTLATREGQRSIARIWGRVPPNQSPIPLSVIARRRAVFLPEQTITSSAASFFDSIEGDGLYAQFREHPFSTLVAELERRAAAQTAGTFEFGPTKTPWWLAASVVPFLVALLMIYVVSVVRDVETRFPGESLPRDFAWSPFFRSRFARAFAYLEIVGVPLVLLAALWTLPLPRFVCVAQALAIGVGIIAGCILLRDLRCAPVSTLVESGRIASTVERNDQDYSATATRKDSRLTLWLTVGIATWVLIKVATRRRGR